MRILYYDWDDFNGEDCRDAMRRLGHEVDCIKCTSKSYDLTPELDQRFREVLFKVPLGQNNSGTCYYDLVFSFDYFPNVSEVCQKYEIPYISWVFDCPHYTLHSHTTSNSVNHIFLFDKSLEKEMQDKGIDTVRHSTLAVNAIRLKDMCDKLDSETDGRIIYEHDVCFLGSLYDNEYNFYDQINYLPPELKGYIDAVIVAQERVFGMDFFTNPEIVNQEHIKRLGEYVQFEKTGKYDLDYNKILLDILRKKVTVNERRNILAKMGKYFDTVLYSDPDAKPIEGVCNLGIADYMTRMPRVFHRSKVNLNITLRSIISGIPLRVVDILAAGGFLLTNYQEEIAERFVDGEDLVIAYTPEEMVEKTAYYLDHEEERQQIARNGQKKVFENFAYTKLLPEILKL
ncbi:glycosyltransferase family protein [Butyrivibrio sp. YAB3001]|uniref:glycosyltransferase family protein n=1 Tax=Butyrivibrio sp. YAB3001 TaxID=1520812 RepID=UPI0008F674F2|nr:glycosyltransferase [Butyrivibrio sp. YAB3001]SFB95506.1 spore maturation protein CgeB [Butyrivibrio sp. YAB3001]